MYYLTYLIDNTLYFIYEIINLSALDPDKRTTAREVLPIPLR